jgi:dTDP-4-amino-4,6-dideoxygalactose transaminase
MRRQLPAYSPITPAGVAAAARAAGGFGPDAGRALQRRLAHDLGASAVRLYASGTQALREGIALARRRTGATTVALPAFTCFDVAAAAVGAGNDLRITLYDVDPATLTPDLDSLRQALHRGAQVVVASPLFGYPVDWDALAREAGDQGAVLVEDAAQGHFAQWRGRPLGSLGDISILSFARGKGWTGGAGGALLLRGPNAEQEEGAITASGSSAELRVLAQLAAQWFLGRPPLYAIPAALPWLHLGETIYHDVPATRRLTRAAAAALGAHLDPSSREVEARRGTARAFLEGLRESAIQPVRALSGASPSYLRLPIRIPGGSAPLMRDPRARRLAVAVGYPATLAQLAPVRPRLDADHGMRWPGAEELVSNLVTLPTHSLLTPEEKAATINLLRAQ